MLENLREIRIAELERRRIEIERFNQERLQEASVMAALEKERRAREKVKIEEYRDKLEQQRKEVERVENERKVEELKKWYVLDAKNRERVSYRLRLQKSKDLAKQERIEKKLALETERKDRLNEVASNVPYFDRIQNLQVDRTRVQSDTKGFVAYKNASEEERRFGSIDGYYDETIWKDVRFKIQSAIRAAGLHQSSVVQRIFQVEVSAPYV